ncbi:hypothetical protein [Natronobacterium haloterrestre]|nr:hypothetical protein [Halobiforma haloterrestris]
MLEGTGVGEDQPLGTDDRFVDGGRIVSILTDAGHPHVASSSP